MAGMLHLQCSGGFHAGVVLGPIKWGVVMNFTTELLPPTSLRMQAFIDGISDIPHDENSQFY